MTDLSGKFRTTHKTLASGRVKIYYFTKPGGTRFFDVMDKPLSQPFPESFCRAHREALEGEGDPVEGEFAQMVLDYFLSPGFAKKAPVTQADYRRDAEVARVPFGRASATVIEDRRFKGKIIRWHENLAKSSPRRADLCLTVLREILKYALQRGVLLHNPAAGIPGLWTRPDDKRPWTAAEIALFLADDCPQPSSDAFHLAMFTGMRRTDLANVTWTAFNDVDIQWETSKGRGRRTVIVPLTPEGIDFLNNLKRRQLNSPLGLQRTILTGAQGRSVTPATVGKLVNDRAKKLEIDNTLHRHRNTYATLLVKADFRPEEIAGIMGWDVAEVDELIRIYVHRDVIVAAQARRLRDVTRL